ncbi:Protein kinase domain-containing protein [Cinnamomum micranthum f. kanehirae]|uniref:non-specific serine/threonine protein kinase n=1 Tax=Cinnamomum micranthum f. kanehirae TaxID=337451 RepID=A0A443PC17_9MAGN|nr:Protein kinase domain-containing protein [Cinnamomum micranthum f. kanehirae]
MHTFRSLPFHFFLVLSCTQLFLDVVTADPISYNCSGYRYLPNTEFATNLDQLLLNLTSKSKDQNFYNYTVGDEPNRIYGLFQCRGDTNRHQCKTCIKISGAEIKQACPNSRQVIAWYDYCLLRYSDQFFFGHVDGPEFHYRNDKLGELSYEEKERVLGFVSKMVKQVPRRRPLMFATNSSSVQFSMFSLAQCNFDLSYEGCEKCLKHVMVETESCCAQYKGWQYHTPSCSVRYETYPFFNGSAPHDELQGILCPDDGTPSNPVFKIKLFLLLGNLTSIAVTSGFSKSVLGDDPNRLYGLAQCRENLAPENCLDCLDSAFYDLQQVCTNSTKAVLWYDNCYFRYSNESFYGIMEEEGLHTVSDLDDDYNINHPWNIYDVAENATKQLLMSADLQVVDEWSRNYHAQCTRDLDTSQCIDCLANLTARVTNCCLGKRSWRYLAVSCSIMYQTIFNSTDALAPAPQRIVVSDPPSLAPPPKERKKQTQLSFRDDLSPQMGVDLSHASMSGGRRRKKKTQNLPLIDLGTIKHATNNFSSENKLGEGGFGVVYKGTLPNGREVAVKRLSNGSKQGLNEFTNEVIYIAKLQHKNLVRLLSCCMEKQEKLLIYEYMPNRSLDAFLFDEDNRVQLYWRRRLNIISGIVRGLLYLHEDSRLKIIHRDLKASNILLDHEMNAKISDFGLARTFRENPGEDNTKYVVGTYGYMAPEYAMNGLFSVKSDVFSFGVLLLEIISGKRNNYQHFPDEAYNLLSYAWILWCDGKVMELIDPMLIDSSSVNDILRLINIGLLCVQEKAADRPTMSSVLLMLGSESMILPQPTQPPLYDWKRKVSLDQSLKPKTCSPNNLTITDFGPR